MPAGGWCASLLQQSHTSLHDDLGFCLDSPPRLIKSDRVRQAFKDFVEYGSARVSRVSMHAMESELFHSTSEHVSIGWPENQAVWYDSVYA
jgi:hypothetical protein